MMEVLTLAIWNTSTCPTLPSRLLISMPSAAWTGSASQPPASASRRARQLWSAGSSRRISGAIAAAGPEFLAARSSGLTQVIGPVQGICRITPDSGSRFLQHLFGSAPQPARGLLPLSPWKGSFDVRRESLALLCPQTGENSHHLCCSGHHGHRGYGGKRRHSFSRPRVERDRSKDWPRVRPGEQPPAQSRNTTRRRHRQTR